MNTNTHTHIHRQADRQRAHTYIHIWHYISWHNACLFCQANVTSNLMLQQNWCRRNCGLTSAPQPVMRSASARSTTNYSILFGAFHLITALRAHDRVHSFRYEFHINNLWAAALSTCRPVDIVFKFHRACFHCPPHPTPVVIIIRNCGFIFISCAC